MRTRSYSLAVLGFDELDLLDVAGPLEVFSSAGRKWNFRAIKATLFSAQPGSLQTRSQLSIGPAEPLASCASAELLLIPGGYGARRAAESREVIDFVKRLAPTLTWTLTVGLGALVAARAGLLANREVACSSALSSELQAIEASCQPKSDGTLGCATGLLSAAHAGSAIELALELVARLHGKSLAQSAARELGYAWGTETLSLLVNPEIPGPMRDE